MGTKSTHGRLGVLFFAFITTFAQPQSLDEGSEADAHFSKENIFGKRFSEVTYVSKLQTRLFIYRAAHLADDGVMTVYLNDRYQTSLLPDAFTQGCIQAESVDLKTRFLSNNPSHSRSVTMDSHLRLSMTKGKVTYLRLSVMPDRLVNIERVPEEDAVKDLQNGSLQIHTLSRADVVMPCLTKINLLNKEAMFKAMRTDVNGLTEQGVQQLEDIVQQIKQAKLKQLRLVLVGYATDGTSKVHNQSLARQRAKTVGVYLVGKGIHAHSVAVVIGDTDSTDAADASFRYVDVEISEFTQKR